MGSHEFSRNQKIVTDGFHDLWARNEKLFSMGIEILGLQYIERGLLRMLLQSTRALNIFGISLSRRVTMGLGN